MMTEADAQRRWMIAIAATFLAIVYYALSFGTSPDLTATWLAGHFLQAGQPDLVYPSDQTHFTMLIPAEWAEYLGETGRKGTYYPFLYPPLWAWLASLVSSSVGIDSFVIFFDIINPLLLVASTFLAMRAAGAEGRDRVLWLGIALATFCLTSIGFVAIQQSQPQILVSFLLIAAIERDRAGATRLAGCLLALAAAIKLYPALVALLWLGERRWGSLKSFAIAGGLLGSASIAVAGWPLHERFLELVALVRDTAVVTSFNYGLDSSLAQIFWRDELIFVASLDNLPDEAHPHGWKILAKGAVWSFASGVAMLGVTSALALGAWQSGKRIPVLAMPAFLTLVALLAPLSWGYHYLPTFAFAPALLLALGTRRGIFLLVACVLPVTGPVFWFFLPPFDGILLNQLIGSVAVAALGLVLWAMRHRV